LDPLDHRAPKASQVFLDSPDRKASVDLLVLMVFKAALALLVSLAELELQGHLAVVDSQVNEALQVNRDRVDRLDRQVRYCL